MKKYLPIEINSIITSECWTFYKIAILQKQPYFDLWLTTHMNSYINTWYEPEYGEMGIRYGMKYYSEVLDIEEVGIKDMEEKHIVDFIISCIDAGKYPIIDLDQTALYNLNYEEPFLHETFFYGYDTEEKCFYLTKFNITYSDKKVPFAAVEKAYSYVRNHYLNNPKAYFLRRKFFFPITTLKPKEYYTPLYWDYEFFARLKRDTLRQTKATDLYDSGLIEGSGDGLRKYIKMDELIDQILYDEFGLAEDRRIKLFNGALKLYEYHLIMSRAFGYALRTYNDEQMKELYDKYTICSIEMDKVRMMVLKYLQTEKPETLQRIRAKLLSLHQSETEVFDRFADRIRESFVIS